MSTTTRSRSLVSIAPVRWATERLSCNSATSCSSPSRWRQRVSDERSNGSSCRNTTSPQKYWKYGFSTNRSHSASSDRLCMCLRMNSPATSRVGSGGRPDTTDRTKAPRQKIPIDLLRQPHQRMAKVDDLRQRRPKQVILTIVARLAHRSPQQRICSRRNHEPPKSGIPKRKKTVGHTPLSCKIDYSLRSNRCDQSMASEYFTDDHIMPIQKNQPPPDPKYFQKLFQADQDTVNSVATEVKGTTPRRDPLRSRRLLRTGHRMANRQVFAMLFPEHHAGSGFGATHSLSMLRRRFAYARLSFIHDVVFAGR